MGSVASTNAGLAELIQTLTSASSPLASQLSSPAVQSALQDAPPGDIVQLSNEALQLQEAGALFADPNQNTSAIGPSSILAALYPASSEPLPIGPASSSTTSETSQSDQVQTLFGTAPTTTSNPLINLIG
jgi:hypothetical protein